MRWITLEELWWAVSVFLPHTCDIDGCMAGGRAPSGPCEGCRSGDVPWSGLAGCSWACVH
jgi:hypothetical protein